MISVLQTIATVVSCAILQQPFSTCVPSAWNEFATEAQVPASQIEQVAPKKTGQAIDVELSARAALVVDMQTGTILYERNADQEMPIASLNKLLSTAAVRSLLPLSTVVTIPPEVKKAQSEGVGIKLQPGEHATVQDLLAASLIPSANDAMVSLAVAAKGSEAAFVDYANQYAASHGYFHTLLANSTGLEEGVQHSTARDVAGLITRAYNDSALRPFLSQQKGELVSREGYVHSYISTDKLLGTYLPVLAAKTGYTLAAKQNLAIITSGPKDQKLVAVVLGSDDRFQDMKTVVEWTYRNYTWP